MSDYPMPPTGRTDRPDPLVETATGDAPVTGLEASTPPHGDPLTVGTSGATSDTHVPTTGLPTSGSGGSADSSKKDVAKSQAADVKDSAAEAGQHVASVAKDQAGEVTAEAGRHARNLVDQGRSELQQQASSQQQRAAGGLNALADELHRLASGEGQPGVAADLARQAGERTQAVASWLEGREPGDVVEEVRTFARQRPGAFLLVAAGAGVLAGRLSRGLKEGPSESSSSMASSTGTASSVAGQHRSTDLSSAPSTTQAPGVVGGTSVPAGYGSVSGTAVPPSGAASSGFRDDVAP